LLQQHIQNNTLAGGEQNTARQSLEAFQYLQQTTQEIHRLAKSIATGLEHDQSLSQLDQAMGSAREISSQFEDAGKQLEMGAQQLETAARSLL
ncbi:MAG: hypothetical protein J2P37_03580, partial [Ktedonobacteraceae bacterium]|nr:hypothetical protein [Ktedonobacteraceae bacterium]